MKSEQQASSPHPLLRWLRQFPSTHLAAAGGLVASLALLVLLLPSDQAESTPHSYEYLDVRTPQFDGAPEAAPAPQPKPEPEPAQALAPIEPEPVAKTEATEPARTEPTREPAHQVKEFTVKSGDSLSRLFQRAGLSDRELYELTAQSERAKELRRIMPGHEVHFHLDEQGTLQRLDYIPSRLSSVHFERREGQFATVETEREPEVRLTFRQGTIDSSLFLAAQQAGISDNMTMALAGIFGWDIDFALNIRRGDQFSLLFEEKYLDGEKIGYGDIVAAEFVNRGDRYRAVRYADAEGRSHYYTPEGRSMRREFLRTPVDFSRISSHFNLKRRHPVLHTIRAHRGTDYAAPTGTPIRSAGDGRVVHAGRKGGYGNTVIVRHGETYKTLYAHMHNIRNGIRRGSRVQQGQVIGYVGASGMATGPHLHYEFLVHGTHRNPVTVDLPKAKSIPEDQLEDFRAATRSLVARLEQHLETTQLASLDDEPERNVN